MTYTSFNRNNIWIESRFQFILKSCRYIQQCTLTIFQTDKYVTTEVEKYTYVLIKWVKTILKLVAFHVNAN